MSRAEDASRPDVGPAGSLDDEIDRISSMNVVELRSLWRQTVGSDPPPGFSKDLLAREASYRLQEHALSGLKPTMVRLLRSLAKPDFEPPRQVKVGSIIVREHKGELHEVMVTPEGFCWRGGTYVSLSAIAKKITGVSWNGPRFFGLRARARVDEISDKDAPASTVPMAPTVGRKSSISASAALVVPGGKGGRRRTRRDGALI